ncbi:hypothetical protein NQN45_004322, partial [Vibrio vulnificus]|nr:hypothetical protein [Vibrio vulnificus]
VGTYNDNGQIKEVEGIPVKMSWVSPDALTAHLSKASAKEGEEVTLTLSACQAGTATVAINTGLDRQNRAQTDALAKIKDGSSNVASKTVNLDANGEATLTLVAPKGGLKSTISITSGGKSATEHVTFSTITSPDVSVANRYGHMLNYVDSPDGVWRYHRAILFEEAKHLTGARALNGKYYEELYLASENPTKGANLCAQYGQILPNRNQISFVRFSNAIPLNKGMFDIWGWSVNSRFSDSLYNTDSYCLYPKARKWPHTPGSNYGDFVGTCWTDAPGAAGSFLTPWYGLSCLQKLR